MHFKEDPQDNAFREEVKAFLGQIPADIGRRSRRHYTAQREDLLRWQRILYDRGWGAPLWDAKDDGNGWTLRQQMIFDEEISRAEGPMVNGQGMLLFGPVLNAFGTEAQKSWHRPLLMKGEVIWCQAFTEPGSGSDLSSLRTTAERDGDGWRINGQKAWTTQAHFADWAMVLARTDRTVRKQQGITFFIVDMKTPGIEVRPVITIDNQHHVNELFFNNVFVPQSGLIATEGQGWKIAKFLLNNERILTAANLPALHALISRLHHLAVTVKVRGRRLIDDDLFADRLAALEAGFAGIEMRVRMAAATAAESSHQDAMISSALKIRGTELRMAMTRLALDAAGDASAVVFLDPERDGAPPEPPAPDYVAGLAAEYFYNRSIAISGGANEIMRNIVAKAVLD